MNSIAFPNIFNKSKIKTDIISDTEATKQNLYLLLKSVRGTLFGDPYFGNNLIQYIYKQNNIVLVDLIKDEIYTCIVEYMPQISIKRDNIVISQEGPSIYASISCINKLTGQNNMFNIKLIDEGDTQ